MSVKWIETRVVFEASNPQAAAELIAEAFRDQGVQGVVLDDPDLEPLEGWGEDAVVRPPCHAVTGYFPNTPDGISRREQFREELRQLAGAIGAAVEIVFRSVDEEDWAEAWKAFFQPQKITDTIVVKPTWRSYRPLRGETVIEIDPGMAFGTGTHPTTALCVGLLETYLKPGARFLDIGTGSGILMVAAAKLGAGYLTGVDNDEVAVEIARKNLLLNGVAAGRFDLIRGDLTARVNGTYDFVVANILSEVILKLLDQIGRLLAPGAIFVASGITAENAVEVAAKMARRDLETIETVVKEQWVAIAARRTDRIL